MKNKKYAGNSAIALLGACALTAAYGQESEGLELVVLPETKVVEEAYEEAVGEKNYSKKIIEATPNVNGNIGGLLIRHPGVNFDNAQNSSSTPGSISPENISINGAKFYDNNFLIDGVSTKSNISGGVIGLSNANDTPEVDIAQGLAIDTKLLCNLKVLDSNVPASYGRFMGGVIEMEVCAPQKKFGGGLSIEHTSHKWLEEKGRDTSESTSISNHEKFNKWIYRGNFESRFSDNFGLVGIFSKKTSEIPLRTYSQGYISDAESNYKKVTSVSENLYLKGFFNNSGDVNGDFSINFLPSTSDGFAENFKDSGYQNKTGGGYFSFGLSHNFMKSRISHRISYKETESSKFSDVDERKTWRYSPDKNWGKLGVVKKTGLPAWDSSTSVEGGVGDIEQKENVFNYKINAALDEFEFLGFKNNIDLGWEFEHDSFNYKRLGDYYQYQTATLSGGISPWIQTCALSTGGVDSDLCSLSPIYKTDGSFQTYGQYLNRRTKYRGGEINYKSIYNSIYLSDRIDFGALSLTLGGRWDKFSTNGEINFAPRFYSSYKFKDYSRSSIHFGLNKYYSQNMKALGIYYQKRSLQSNYEVRKLSSGLIGEWEPADDNSMPSRPDGLKTPFTNEASIGYNFSIQNFDWKLKYVKRESKDEVGSYTKGGVFYWDNSGSSSFNVFSLSVENNTPFLVSKSETFFSFVFDYSKKKSTHSNWNDRVFDSNGMADQVYYKGKLINDYELPVQNYNIPWTLRFMTSTEIKPYGVKLDSILRVKKGYQKVAKVSTMNGFGVWDDVKMENTINFDLKISKDWKLSKMSKIYAEITLENVFNKSNQYDYDTEGYLLEKGRQATLRVGYEF